MSGLQGKRWFFFVWDAENVEHLAEHGIHPGEAEQVFFNRYIITPNKKKYSQKRYRIDGISDSGRCLRLIFEDKGKKVARIFTGWDL
jgi:uncharacterized DUF497 family protein